MNANLDRLKIIDACTYLARPMVLCSVVFLCTITSVHVLAQTAPCTPHKSCVVERDGLNVRNALELNGPSSDPADALVDKSTGRRYWLRCWQKGVLITERMTRTPPPESSKAVSVTGSDDKTMKLFDLRNATCAIEAIGGE
jgi:hypothetical protein